MSRRSLRPQLNQIRGWVRQGRTDAWIAHQLEVTVQQIQAFKREQGLEPDAEENGAGVEEVDLRAEDDAQIAAELEAGGRAQGRRGGARRRGGRAQGGRGGAAAEAAAAAEAEDDEDEKPKRAARRRGGRSRRRTAPDGPARGHVRPRRGGLRPVAGPRRAGRPDLRRALGGPPPRRDHDRGRPDRDPPLRRRRGRQTTTDRRARGDRLAARAGRAGRAMRSSRGRTAPCCGRRRRPTTGTSTPSASRARGLTPRGARWRAADELLAGSRHRKLDVEDEATGAAARAVLRGRRLDGRPRYAMMRREGPGRRARRRRGGAAGRDARAAGRVVHGATTTTSRRRSASPSAQEPVVARRGDARVRRARRRASRSASPCRRRRRRGRDRPALRHAERRARRGHRRARWSRRRWPPAGATWPGSSPTTRAARERLYERLGFETVWRPYGFVRRPG